MPFAFTARFGTALCAAVLALPAVAQQAAPASSAAVAVAPDWVQIGTRGIDAAVSEDGQRWYVGTDGRAWRRDEAAARWVAYGTRSDLVRIDAAREGAAAITRSGELLVTGNAATGEWRPTGMRAADAGIGKGRIWLADALQVDGSRTVMHADFDASGSNMNWSVVPGRVQRIDVDGEGRPWALDAEGRLFVYANDQWIADTTALAASDVAVSINGTVLLVGRQANAALGGGTLHARHPQTGVWSVLPGRLTAVSAEPDGRAFGVNSLSWVLSSARAPVLAVLTPPPAPKPELPALKPSQARLADLADAGVALPATLADVVVTITRGNAARPNDLLSGSTTLNGLPARVVRFAPAPGGPTTLLLWHARLPLGDYLTALQGTGVQNLALSNAVFAFVPEGNVGKKPAAADATAFATAALLARNDLTDFAPPAGTSLRATFDMNQIAQASILPGLLGAGTSSVAVTAQNLDEKLFADVSMRDTRVVANNSTLKLADVKERYGEKLLNSLVLRAPVATLAGKAFGPAAFAREVAGSSKGPAWTFTLAEAEGALTFEVALETDLTVAVRAAQPAPTGQTSPSAANPSNTPNPPAPKPGVGAQPKPGTPSPSPPQPETLALKDVRIAFKPRERSATLTGSITRAAADNLASFKDFKLSPAVFTGALTVATGITTVASLNSFSALDLAFNTSGELPARVTAEGTTSNPVKADLEVSFALNDERTALVPKVLVSGNLTLAHIVGSNVPGADKIALTSAEWSPGYVAGAVSLNGAPVRAVRYQAAGMPAAIVGIHHQELELGTYIPKIRNTSLGTVGLANVVLFVLPESASAVTWGSRVEMPAPLAALLNREAIPDADIFPLSIRPGINLIGQFGSNPEADGGNAKKVMAVFGVDDKTYVVKANFKASALRHAAFRPRAPGVPSRPSAKDVACGAVSAAEQADASGLDLSFAVPNFRPRYASGAMSFSNTTFALKEVDGQLEPSIVTAMTLRLPQAAAGVRSIGMATKIRVKGDLNQLCGKVTPDSNIEVAFAGSTALNIRAVGDAAFDALEKVTQLDKPEETAASTDGATAAVPPALAQAVQKLRAAMRLVKPIPGWKPPGLDFVEIRKFASAGTFTRKDGKDSIVSTIWTESGLGSETVDVLGSVTYESDAGAAEFKLSNWLLRAPGPVLLRGLPGVNAYARSPALPFIELGDLSVSNLELTPTQMQGQLSSRANDFSGQVVLMRQAVTSGTTANAGAPSPAAKPGTAPQAAPAPVFDFDLYASVNRFSPNWFLKKEAQLPGVAGAVVLGKTLIAMRTGPAAQSKSTRISALPKPVAAMFTGTIGDLVTAESEVPQVRGFSIAGRVTPGEVPDTQVLRPLKGLFNTLDLNNPMPVFGGLEAGTSGAAVAAGFVDVLIPAASIPGLPQGQLRFANTRLALASLSGTQRVSLNTDVIFTPPAALRPTLGNELRLAGTLAYERETAGDTLITVAAMSNAAWKFPESFLPAAIPGITFGNIGIEAQSRFKSEGGQRATSLMLTSDASLGGVAARARLGVEADGSASTGGLLELVARNPAGSFNLASLINPQPLLPANYSVVNLANYLDLRARGILIAKEAGSGRVTLAAEDVSGRVNGQSFKGQLALTGLAGPQPALFISNDERWTPARIFPAAIPKGPFASLPLPDGLLILSSANGDANISALHPRIYDKVFAKLFGAREAARVLMNSGLTVVSKLNLAQDAPPVLGQFTGWLPGSGDMVVGGGIDSSSGGLAFYADIPGLRLPIPPPFNTFINSADGQVQLYFKTAGASGTGAEVGVSGNVNVGVPRLDNPASIQRVAATLSLFSTTAAGQSPTLAIGVKVPGTWVSPAGLDGFSLTDTDVAFGTGGTGTTVSVATQRAQFQSGGETKAFALDLKTAWLGGAPTQLSVQFAKSPDTAELIITPALQAELANSVLHLALKGGSALNASISTALGTQGIDGPARAAFDGVATLIKNSANGAATLMRSSPLSMIGVKNPVLYLVTPGNDLPPRPGIEQPPFGLGLLVQGQLILDIGTQQVNLANGVYKINLRDGFFVSGTLTPPSPFSANTFEVSGTQPLISPTPNALRVSGRLALPGMNLVPGVDASLAGSFEFNKPLALNAGADVKGNVSIGGLANRDAYFTVRTGSIRVYSAPGGCIDVPLKLDGNVSVDSLTNPASLLTVATPAVPDVADCLPLSLGDLAKVGEIGANFVKNVAIDLFTENPVENVKKAYELGKQGVELAANTAQAAGTLALNLASVVVNPSQAYQSAKAAFDGAVKLASQAADALANIGCKLVSWMPGDHPCRKRERQKRAEKDAADRAAFEAAVALGEEQRKLEAQIQNTMVSVEVQRWNAEKAREAWRGKKREAVNNVLRSAGSIKSASWCGDGQFFSASLGRCWDATNDGPLGLLAHTGDGGASCLAQRRYNFLPPSLRGNCEVRDGYKFARYYTDIKWRFMPNGQIRSEEMQAPRFGSGPARWLCLTIQRNSEWISAEQRYRFTENLAAPVVMGNCEDNSPAWRYTPKGELMSPSGYCLVPAKTAVTVPRSASAMVTTYAAGTLFLKPCNDASIAVQPGRLRWTPIVPVDAGQLAGLPTTAKLRAGAANSALCIGGSGGFLDRFTLERCNAANDLEQYFAFGVEGSAGSYVVTVAARNTDLCIGTGGNPEDPNEVLGMPCYGSAAQKFDVVGDAKAGSVQFRNRGTGKCLAIDGGVVEGAELAWADCATGDAAQRFSVTAASTQGKTFTRKAIPTEALRDVQALEDLRKSVLYRNVVVEPFSRPAQGIRAGGLDGVLAQAGSPQRWFVLPGRVGGNNYVSLSTPALDLQDWADFADRKKLLMAKKLPPANPRIPGVVRNAMLGISGAEGQLVVANNKVGDAVFDLNATFEVVAGLNGVPGTVSFRSVADSTRYVRLVASGNFFVEAGSDAAFNNSATFRLKAE